MSTPLMTAEDASTPAVLRNIKALTFDIIGTCTDWHSVVSSCLRVHAPSNVASTSSPSTSDTTAALNSWASEFAHNWRSAFFRLLLELHERQQMMSGGEVYKVTLKQTMDKFGVSEQEWGDDVIHDLIKSWETASAWNDTAPGLRLLRRKFVLLGLTNGTTIVTINTNRRTGMEFDGIINSDIVGAYKPNPKMYQTALKALGASEGEVAMVAAHAYDLEAAKKCGFKTIYIRRATEDMDIDDAAIAAKEFDLVVNEGGLVELARRLGCEV
ncbi:hypothetical protein FRC00_007746 [Tulasnella sp. 408]|nr:hypothetical protein FRC00_007746 [Tulasnella sp. 408]